MELSGKRVAILIATGYREHEFLLPNYPLKAAGGQCLQIAQEISDGAFIKTNSTRRSLPTAGHLEPAAIARRQLGRVCHLTGQPSERPQPFRHLAHRDQTPQARAVDKPIPPRQLSALVA